MKSVDRLRDCTWIGSGKVNEYLDEIEREIAETEAFCRRVEEAARNNDELDVFGVVYTPLPTDADGVPIRVGDAITLPNGRRDDVRFITIRKHDTVFNERGWVPSQCTHSKPRTLEDVLTDVVTLCANAWKDDKSPFAFYDVSDVMGSGNIKEYADEIRELLGGDAE